MKKVSTFKSPKSLLNHIRALTQLAASSSNCTLPLFHLECHTPYIISRLPLLRKGYYEGLYFVIREHGFEFEYNTSFFKSCLDSYNDIIQSYVLTYSKGCYFLSSYPQK